MAVDSIGAALSHGGNKALKFWRDYSEFLVQLNDVGNAYRHSFLNLDSDVFRGQEPRLHALALGPRRPRSGAQFFDVPLAPIVKEFSKFYAACIGWLKDFSARCQARTTVDSGLVTVE
jgi:hypothetical protein